MSLKTDQKWSLFYISPNLFMSDFSALLVDIVLSFDVLYPTYLSCGVFGAETLSRCSCPSFHPLNSIALPNIFLIYSFPYYIILCWNMGIIVSFFLARFVYLLGSDKTSRPPCTDDQHYNSKKFN